MFDVPVTTSNIVLWSASDAYYPGVGKAPASPSEMAPLVIKVGSTSVFTLTNPMPIQLGSLAP